MLTDSLTQGASEGVRVHVKIATLPAPYKDPDEFVQAVRAQTAAQPLFSRTGPDGVAAAAAATARQFEEQVVLVSK